MVSRKEQGDSASWDGEHFQRQPLLDDTLELLEGGGKREEMVRYWKKFGNGMKERKI